ncbi:MAG: DoxX family protein [Solirubrobacteraceae bacterium]|nr:DoxX family protein [Solirubrobacteraceae bacterium]
MSSDRSAKHGGRIFIFAGLMHFINPKMYERIMPKYLPAHRELVYASGVTEALGGLLVLSPKTRVLGGWILLLTIIGVYPANVHMALNPDDYPEVPKPALWIRLPLQFPMALWAWRMIKPKA